jgi:hypothetical protein
MFEPGRGPLFELSGGGLKPSRGEGWVDPEGVAVRAKGEAVRRGLNEL